MRRALACNQAILGQMTADGVDDLRALAHQQIAGPEHDGRCLLGLTLDGDETHGRALGRFADRFGICGIVLLPLDERLHVSRRNQPHLVPQLGDLTCPVVSARARLHGDKTARLRGEEGEHLIAPQPLAEQDSPETLAPCAWNTFLARSNPIVLTSVTDASLQVAVDTTTLARRCRRGASTPSPKSVLSCAGCSGPSAPTGRRRRSCCAPTATIAARRSSTGAALTGSTSSSASRQPRPCAGMSSAWKPARWRATPPPRRRARCAATRSSTTAPRAGAGSSASSLVSRPGPTEPTPASSSQACRPEALVCSMTRSIAGAARRRTTSRRGRRTWLPIGPPARMPPPTSSGCFCMPVPTGCCGACAR